MTSGIYKLKLRLSDRIKLWFKFQLFRIFRPKEHKEIVQLVNEIHKSYQELITSQLNFQKPQLKIVSKKRKSK